MSILWSWDASHILGIIYAIALITLAVPSIILYHVRRHIHPISLSSPNLSWFFLIPTLFYLGASSASLLLSSAYPCILHVLISTLCPHLIQLFLSIKASQLLLRYCFNNKTLKLRQYQIGRIHEKEKDRGRGITISHYGGPTHQPQLSTLDETTFLDTRTSALSTSSTSSAAPTPESSNVSVPSPLLSSATRITQWLRPNRWLTITIITSLALVIADILFLTLHSALARYDNNTNDITHSTSNADINPATCDYTTTTSHAFQIMRGVVMIVHIILYVTLCMILFFSSAPSDVHGHRIQLYASLTLMPLWALLYIVFPALWPDSHTWEYTWGSHLQVGACAIVLICHVIWPLMLSYRAQRQLMPTISIMDSSSSITERGVPTRSRKAAKPHSHGPRSSPSSSPRPSKSHPNAAAVTAVAGTHVMDVDAHTSPNVVGLSDVLSTKDGWLCWLEYAEKEFVVPAVICYESLLQYRSLFSHVEHPHLHARNMRLSITTFIEERASIAASNVNGPPNLPNLCAIFDVAATIYHTFLAIDAPFRVPLSSTTSLHITRIFTLYNSPSTASTVQSTPAESVQTSPAAPTRTLNMPSNSHSHTTDVHYNSYRTLPQRHTLTYTQLMAIFDDVIRDVWKLMDGPVFARFRCTRAYRLLCMRGHQLHRLPPKSHTDPHSIDSDSPRPTHTHPRPRARSQDPPGVRHGSYQEPEQLPSPMQLQADLPMTAVSTSPDTIHVVRVTPPPNHAASVTGRPSTLYPATIIHIPTGFMTRPGTPQHSQSMSYHTRSQYQPSWASAPVVIAGRHITYGRSTITQTSRSQPDPDPYGYGTARIAPSASGSGSASPSPSPRSAHSQIEHETSTHTHTHSPPVSNPTSPQQYAASYVDTEVVDVTTHVSPAISRVHSETHHNHNHNTYDELFTTQQPEQTHTQTADTHAPVVPPIIIPTESWEPYGKRSSVHLTQETIPTCIPVEASAPSIPPSPAHVSCTPPHTPPLHTHSSIGQDVDVDSDGYYTGTFTPLVASSYAEHDNIELLALTPRDPPSPHTILRHHDLPSCAVPTPAHASLYEHSSLYGGTALSNYSHPTVFSILARCNEISSVNVTDCDVSDRWQIPDTQYA